MTRPALMRMSQDKLPRSQYRPNAASCQSGRGLSYPLIFFRQGLGRDTCWSGKESAQRGICGIVFYKYLI